MNKDLLLEARTIDDEYKKEYSDIPREDFDKILALDPQTNLEKNKIGRGANQLLLPAYQNGETDFIDNKDVTTALDTFYKNISTYPVTLRNIANFPSVKDFVDYIINGENSEFAKNFDFDTAEEPKEKESKLDALYKKFYEKSIDRETFNKIIELDPKTSEDSIGNVAKNLLLPKFIAGENFFDDLRVEKAIATYYAESSNYTADKRELTRYPSVNEFVNFVMAGPESPFLADLRANYTEGKQFKVLGSTKDYDIVQPLCWEANTRIVGKKRPTDDSSTAKLRWCTGYYSSPNYWNSYSGYGPLIDFIYKPDRYDRKKCYQLNLNRNGTIHEFLNGDDSNPSGKGAEGFFEQVLAANIDVAFTLSTIELFKSTAAVNKVISKFKEAAKPIEITSVSDVKIKIDKSDIKGYVRELIIKMETIPASLFANYTSLKKLTLEGVKKIGVESFFNCTSLQKIELPEGLEEIATEAFAGCISLRGWTRVPDSLRRIGRDAFRQTSIGLSINRARTTPLQVDPNDEDWFTSHAKLITVQESLEEDIIDENIPRDLARAYQRSNAAVNGLQNHPNSRHKELQQDDEYRKDVHYDYYRSNYEELSKQQAIEYLGLDVRDTDVRDENGKIAAKARTTNREQFNSRICDLRFIIDNRVVEYEVRGANNALYLAYWLDIPDRYFADYPKFRGKDGLTNDVRFANKYSDIYTIIQIADKIYKTDEYQHEITDTTPTGKKIKKVTVNPETGEETSEIVDDTIKARRQRNKETKEFRTWVPNMIQDEQGNWIANPDHRDHAADYNFGGDNADPYNFKNSKTPNTKIAVSVPDSGAHAPREVFKAVEQVKYFDYSEYEEYCEKVEEKRELFKKYDYLRSAISKLQKEQDLYDESEFNDTLESLSKKKEETYKKYQDICLEVRKLRDKLVLVFDSITAAINKDIKEYLKLRQSKVNKEYDVYKKHQALMGQEIYQTSPRLRELKKQIERYDEDINYYNQEKDRILKQLEQLQKQLKNQDISIEKAVAESAKLLAEADKLSEEEVAKKYAQLDALKAEMIALQKEIADMSPTKGKIKQSSEQPKKKMDPELAKMLNFGKEETGEEGGDPTNPA